MNKIEKLLNKLDSKTRTSIEIALLQIAKGRLSHLDVKKIKNTKDYYRARVGKYRIIFRLVNRKTKFITVTRRDDRTYKKF